MKKTILSFIIFFICTCYISASEMKGNDFKYLQTNEKESTDKIKKFGPPPTNLHAIGQYLEIFLYWDEPDFTNTYIKSKNGSGNNSYNTSRDTVLLGYNIYRDSTFAYTVGPNVTEYNDEIVYPERDYVYWVTAVYGDGESIPSNSDTASAWSGGSMPHNFWLDWATTGKWYEIPVSPNNWEYYASGQCARLSWSPSTPNYDMSLVSEEFTLPADTSLIFDFIVNMYIDDYSVDTGEKMEIWLVHDSVETMIFQWDLDENDDWGVSGGQDWVYTDTDQFAGETVKIKFRSHGGDTYNINYWYVYSVWFQYNYQIDYGILEGVVTDSEGEPLEMVAVQANYSKYNPVYTNEDGEYLIDPIQIGFYDVNFSKDGYTTATVEDVEIVKDSTSSLEMVMGQPTMEIQPTLIQEVVDPDEPVSVPITVANNGTGSLKYYVHRISEDKTDYNDCTGGILVSNKKQDNYNNSKGFRVESTSKDDVILHYDGENYEGIGLFSGGAFFVAARFTEAELADFYEIYSISAVQLYIRDMPSSVVLKIWEGGSYNGPDLEVYSQNVTSQISANAWCSLSLDTPINLLPDEEYWMGYKVNGNQGNYLAGCDAGPAVDGKGDWFSFDQNYWDEIQNYGLDNNWNIRAFLSPEPNSWLNFSPDSGFVEAGNTDEVTVYLNTIDHNPGEILTAQLQFTSEPDVGSQIVDVEVEVGEFAIPGQEEVTKTFLQGSFPNPATTKTTIKYSIKKPTHVKISVFNLKGRLVETLVDEHSESGVFEVEWNPKNISSGIYFLQLKTEEKTYLKKMIMMI